MSLLLNVDNLKKVYGHAKHEKTTILKDVSFSLHRGEIVGLIGSSGAGKSTVGRILASLEQQNGGTIWFDGSDLTELTGKRRRVFAKDIQMIFQDPYDSLSGRMRIQDLVEEPLIIQKHEKDKGKRRQLVNEALSLVSLDPKKYGARFPHELSGGERQRVGVARALVCRPKLIICDEPTSMLDTSLRLELIELLKKLNEQFSIAYLFITHDIALTKGFCHRLLVLYEGSIVDQGDTETVIEYPEHPFTIKLIQALRSLENTKGESV